MNPNEIALTVLGSSSAIPRPGRACSAYLLSSGVESIVLDFGSGAFSNLLRYRTVSQVSAIFISHLHADHVLDLIPMRYALRYGIDRRMTPLPVYVPPGGREVLERFASTLSGEQNAFFDGIIDLREYQADQSTEIAGFKLNFASTQHYIDAYSFRVTRQGLTIVYSGDTASDAGIIEHARNADLFICEATLGAHGVESGKRGHCSARDAGVMARQARVRRLALTHYGVEHSPSTLQAGAAAEYGGPIDVLDDHRQMQFPMAQPTDDTYDVESPTALRY